MIKQVCFCSLVFFYSSVFAEALPKRTAYDHRTRTINYNPQQVFKINAYMGFSTTIILNKDEKYKAHTLGDPTAWDFAKTGNYIFIRPKLKQGNTNLFVLTDKRHYNFDLRSHTDRVYNNDEVSVFTVTFHYPKQEAKKRKLAEERKKLERSLRKSKSLVVNTSYQGCGDLNISPIAVYDNNMQTFFKFSPNTPLPSLYVIHNGQEQLINYNVENDWISVHDIAKEFILRRGEAVACVTNLGNVNGTRSGSGTVSDDVFREVKSND